MLFRGSVAMQTGMLYNIDYAKYKDGVNYNSMNSLFYAQTVWISAFSLVLSIGNS
jgi:hypothetical protein